MTKRIILTGAGGSAGMNFLKSLEMGPEKFFVATTDINKYHMELVKSDKHYLVPRCNEPEYIDVINKIIANNGIEFLHCQPDVEVSFWAKNRHKVHTKTFLPAQETVELCQDKMKLNAFLSAKNIPVPTSILIEKPEDIALAFETIKTEKLWLRAIHGAGSRASLPIKEPKHAEMWIDYWKKMRGIGYGDFMIADFLPGREFAFQSLWKDGELITSATRERLEYVFGELTPSGQSSSPSVALSVHEDKVNQLVTEAIQSIDPKATGVFCADLKEDGDRQPRLTEINLGRFFTTSNFFAEAGSNMPYYYVKMAYGEELPKLPQYNAVPKGLYWIRLIDGSHKMVKDGEWIASKI